MSELNQKVFGGWPKSPPPLAASPSVDLTKDGIRLRAIDFTSETGVVLRMWVMTSPKVETSAELIVTVLDDAGWERWCNDLGPEFADALQLPTKPKRDDAKFAQNRAAMENHKWAFAAITPRGIGPTRWAVPGSKEDVQIRRRFPLIGQTLDGQRVWDVRRGVSVLRTIPGLSKVPLTLQGEGDAAGIALYAAIFEPTVSALDLWHLSPSHEKGPIFLNVRKYFDVPHALALALPRKITLHVRTDEEVKNWSLPIRLDAASGANGLTIKVVGE